MTVLSRDGLVTTIVVQAAGDGGPGTAASVPIPSPHTRVLVELPISGMQAIKIDEGNIGDEVDIFVISRPSTGSHGGSKLRVYDHEGNNLVQTDETMALLNGSWVNLSNVGAYSQAGFTSFMQGSWIGEIRSFTVNYPPST